MSPSIRFLPAVLIGVTAFAAIGTTGARAEPKVVASIAPLQSLAAKVMKGVGEPALLVPPGASPHHYALRPSEAKALEQADVVFWVGEALEPFLERPLETLAKDAHVVELSAANGVTILPTREGGAWEPHDHDHEAEHQDGHEDEHGHEEARHHDHDHDGIDPHLWLDPKNAEAWVRAMADALENEDPANADTYRANAEAAAKDLSALQSELAATLTPVKTRPYVVFHDAYQYFESRFGLSAVGSVTLSDARTPTPARLQEVRAKITDAGAACVFAEPQFEPRVIDTIVEGTQARKGILDPLGADLPLGADQYDALLKRLAASLVECLN